MSINEEKENEINLLKMVMKGHWTLGFMTFKLKPKAILQNLTESKYLFANYIEMIMEQLAKLKRKFIHNIEIHKIKIHKIEIHMLNW